MSALRVSGHSEVLLGLLQHCLEAVSWLRVGPEALEFDWPAAAGAWHRAVKPTSPLDERVSTALTALMPQLPLALFATTAVGANYFQGDERTAGLALQTHPMPTDLLQLLDRWANEVDRFRASIQMELRYAEQRGEVLYQDGLLPRAVALASALTTALGLQQTLNVRLDLTGRLVVANADMAVLLSGSNQPYPYQPPTLPQRREVWRDVQRLSQLRLDLLAALRLDGHHDRSAQAEIIASLARHEHRLWQKLSAGGQTGRVGEASCLQRQPGYAVLFADQTSLAFDMSPFAAAGSLLRQEPSLVQEVMLPPPQEVLARALRQIVPNPYSLTARHATEAGVAAARSFAVATDQLQNQLRRVDLRAVAAPAPIDASVLIAADQVEQVLQWALQSAPLVTLVLSGFLATYREAQGWGFALSPWVMTDALSVKTLGALPLTYMGAGAEQGESAELVGQDEGRDEEASEDVGLTGDKVWQAVLGSGCRGSFVKPVDLA